MKTRLHFLDNLRTFMILMVIVLHTGIVYEPILMDAWIVSDPAKVNSLGLVRMYIDLFVMFTLFFISGYFIPLSAKTKSARAFIASKFKRIMLPWLFGVLVLIPAYKFIFLYARDLPQQAWYTYFHFFNRTGGNPYYFADNPTQSWLWFLPVLFLFQMIYLGLYRAKLLPANLKLRCGVVLTFATGLAYTMLISLTNLNGWYHSWLLHFQNERLLVYFAVFLLGTLSHRLRVFDPTRGNKRLYIVANVVLSVSLAIYTVTALNLFFNLIQPGRNHFFISSVFDRIIFNATLLLSMLSFLYVLTYTFRYSLNRTSRLLGHLSRNSYGVYVVHMVVLGTGALLMLHLQWPPLLKYFILIIYTFLLSNVVVYALREAVRSLRRPLTKPLPAESTK